MQQLMRSLLKKYPQGKLRSVFFEKFAFSIRDRWKKRQRSANNYYLVVLLFQSYNFHALSFAKTQNQNYTQEKAAYVWTSGSQAFMVCSILLNRKIFCPSFIHSSYLQPSAGLQWLVIICVRRGLAVPRAGDRSYVASSIHGWSRSHSTLTELLLSVDSKSASSLRSLPQLLLNFQFNIISK